MAQGLLEVTGSIGLSQFWPQGESDADTIRVKVADPGQDFRFRPDPGAPFRVTQAFQGALVSGSKGRRPVMKNGELRIRLQGVDAPELHYTPPAEQERKNRTQEQQSLYLQWNEKYRQFFAETATLALAQFLRTLGGPLLPCTVRTAVDSPGDVFDVYGRFVGNVFVQTPSGEQDVNLWLAENGWVMPAFYTSMSAEEIQAITDAATRAYFAGLGVWPLYSSGAGVQDFDPNLRYRRKLPQNAAPDVGPVIVPKLFRRLSTFVVNRKAKMVTGSFEAYLRSKRPGDAVHRTSEFLEQGAGAAPLHFLDEFVESGQFIVWPEEIIFREQPSTLVDSSNREIQAF